MNPEAKTTLGVYLLTVERATAMRICPVEVRRTRAGARGKITIRAAMTNAFDDASAANGNLGTSGSSIGWSDPRDLQSKPERSRAISPAPWLDMSCLCRYTGHIISVLSNAAKWG